MPAFGKQLGRMLRHHVAVDHAGTEKYRCTGCGQPQLLGLKAAQLRQRRCAHGGGEARALLLARRQRLGAILGVHPQGASTLCYDF